MTIEFGSSHFDVIYAAKNGNLKIACTRGLEKDLDKMFKVSKAKMIGRDYGFDDPKLSNSHGKYDKDEEGNWYYQDLGSERGSYRILLNIRSGDFSKYQLKPGDILKFAGPHARTHNKFMVRFSSFCEECRSEACEAGTTKCKSCLETS